MREREEQLRLASERRLHKAAVVKQKGPALMRRVQTEIAAAVDEYRHVTHAGSNDIEFEEQPSDGFYVARMALPKVSLECRPAYESQALHCNMTRRDGQ